MNRFNVPKTSIVLAFMLLISGCGSDGDTTKKPNENPFDLSPKTNQTDKSDKNNPNNPNSKPNNTNSNPNISADDFRVVGDTKGNINQPVGMALVRPNVAYNRYEWRQIAGPSVDLLANKQPAVSFTPKKSGLYRFEVTTSMDGKNSITKQHDIQVSNLVATAQLQKDRASSAKGLISLRLFDNNVTQASQWRLQQKSGSLATIKKDNRNTFAQIRLPNVIKDEVITFEAKDSKGKLLDTAYVLVQPAVDKKAKVATRFFCDEHTSSNQCLHMTPIGHHYAYKADSPVADVLVRCTMSRKIETDGFCKLNQLSFIGENNRDPSIDDIMNRVVVSHDWMGKNLETFLKKYDIKGDFRHLFRSVTSIVISDNIKPSFYWRANSTIYLEPDFFWLTPDEQYNITERSDFRSDFGKTLNFLNFGDYVQNKKSIYGSQYFVDRGTKNSRALNHIAPPLASLLYHELAHANDYYPFASIFAIANANKNKTPNVLIPKVIASSVLAKDYPLQNQQMKDLAKVLFYGKQPSKAQQNYRASQVSDWFFNDVANVSYAYANPREDFAMLFEEAMMLTRFNVDRYQMVMDVPNDDLANATVDQGEKNRITDPRLYERASFVINRVLPEAYSQATQVLANKSPTPMCKGANFSTYKETNCDAKFFGRELQQGLHRPDISISELPKQPWRDFTMQAD